MRLTLTVGLAFALLIAGCSNKPAPQDPQAPGSSTAPAKSGDASSTSRQSAAGSSALPAAPGAAVGASTPSTTAGASTPGSTGGPAVQPSLTSGDGAGAAVPGPSTAPAKPPASAALATPSATAQSAPSPSAKSPVGTIAKAPAASPPSQANAAAVATKSAPTLDISSLTQRLKDTKAIGVLSKLALKNQVDDLLDQFRAFYQGKLKTTLAELRRPYDLLVLKVLALLQDDDPSLASAIVASREAIWGILSDPKKFATVA